MTEEEKLQTEELNEEEVQTTVNEDNIDDLIEGGEVENVVYNED